MFRNAITRWSVSRLDIKLSSQNRNWYRAALFAAAVAIDSLHLLCDVRFACQQRERKSLFLATQNSLIKCRLVNIFELCSGEPKLSSRGSRLKQLITKVFIFLTLTDILLVYFPSIMIFGSSTSFSLVCHDYAVEVSSLKVYERR